MIKVSVSPSLRDKFGMNHKSVGLVGFDTLKGCKTVWQVAAMIPSFAEANKVSQRVVIQAVNRFMGLPVTEEDIRKARNYVPTGESACPRSHDRGDGQDADMIRWDRYNAVGRTGFVLGR